jgi:hypothetical protein
MRGAQVAGDTVKADIGGNLNIESLQDITNYASQQSSGGVNVSLCIPPICFGEYVSATVDYSKQRVNHNYRSATGQSGIVAGNGGFDVAVKGNTDLKGGAITSTAPIDKNSFTTGSLTTSDLENKQRTNSSSTSGSVSVSSGANAYSAGTSAATNAARSVTNTALANLNGGRGLPGNNDQTSQTLSVISPGTIKIIGTGVKEVDDKSSANVATLTSRDPATANGALVNALTLQQAKEIPRLQQEAQDRQRAAQLVGSVVDNVIGDVSHSLHRQAQEQENQRATAAGEAPRVVTAWADGSTEKIVLHGLAGIVQARIGDGSTLAGAAAGALNEALLPVMADFLKRNGYDYEDPTLTPEQSAEKKQAFDSLLMAGSTLVGATVGAAAGGSSGASIAATVANNATANNFLKHDQAKDLNKELDACKAKPGGCSDEEGQVIFNKYKNLSDQNIAQVQACIFTGDTQCVTKAVGDAASRADVQNTALNPAQQNLLTVRQTNAGTNSVTGGDGITSGDLQRAQEVKNFREANCADLSAEQCDAKVSDAIGRGQLSSVAMVGTALGLGVAIEGATTAGAALGGAIRACAADPLLCANTAGIVAADALTLGATGTGALTVGAVRATGGGGKAATQLIEDTRIAAKTPVAAANPNAVPPSGLISMGELTPVAPTASGSISATKINSNGFALTDLTSAEQTLASRVVAQGDQSGNTTERLIESVAKRQNMTSLPGGRYGSNNGFDHVFQNADGTVTVLVDSKQIVNGAASVSTQGAGGTTQLSDAWVRNVLDSLDRSSPAYKAVSTALINGSLIKGIAGVDRATSSVMIIRVK